MQQTAGKHKARGVQAKTRATFPTKHLLNVSTLQCFHLMHSYVIAFIITFILVSPAEVVAVLAAVRLVFLASEGVSICRAGKCASRLSPLVLRAKVWTRGRKVGG